MPNPTTSNLIKPITVAEYNFRNPGAAPVRDSNGDGKVTEADKGVRNQALENVCRDKAPDESRIAVTEKARGVLAKYHASVETKTVNGTTYDQLRFANGEVARSYGGYDPSVGACHYNRSGFQVSEGRNDHEIRLKYADARGPHEEFLDLVSGKQTKLK